MAYPTRAVHVAFRRYRACLVGWVWLLVYILPYPFSSLLQRRESPMSSPSSPALQRLHSLQKSFHDQLRNALRGDEYQRSVQKLQTDDLEWLINYLEKVCRLFPLPHLRSSQRRLSMVSIPQVIHSRRVYANSERYAALMGCSQHRTTSRLTS